MKVSYLLIFCFSTLLFSCNNRSKDISQVSNSGIDSIKYHRDMDYKCETDSLRAVKDIKNGKLKYFYYNGLTTMYRSNKEMKLLLSKYNIEIDSVLTFCTDIKGQMNCYPHEMYKEINKRYGEKFIDSLRNIAELMYVKNNINKVFPYSQM